MSGLFVASFFASMFYCFWSDFGVILGGFGEPKSIIFGVEILWIFACRSKSGPRAAKSGPRATKSGPGAPQERPREPKSTQEVPQQSQRAAQETPKKLPRGSQEAPRDPQEASKKLQQSQREPQEGAKPACATILVVVPLSFSLSLSCLLSNSDNQKRTHKSAASAVRPLQ